MPDNLLDKISEVVVHIEESEGEAPTFSTVLDCEKETNFETEERKLRLDILNSAVENSNKIFLLIDEQEKSKNRWRIFFIISLTILLVFSVDFAFDLIKSKVVGNPYIESQLILGIFAYIIANILSILYFMIKYINNNEYLEMFKVVTHKMLDFLVQKGTQNDD